jgi:hypothetical protein
MSPDERSVSDLAVTIVPRGSQRSKSSERHSGPHRTNMELMQTLDDSASRKKDAEHSSGHLAPALQAV